MHYVEKFGDLGFGAELTLGERIDITAAPLLRRSPHVLYTNVVEPVLRWTFVERGYALVHAACMASGDNGVPDHGPHRHGQDHDALKTLDSLPVLVPLGRPDAAHARRAGAHVPEAADDQPAHALAVKTPLLTRKERHEARSSRAACTRSPGASSA